MANYEVVLLIVGCCVCFVFLLYLSNKGDRDSHAPGPVQYRPQAKEERIHYGEQQILSCLCHNFTQLFSQDTVIYHQLEFKTPYGLKRVDFFVVSPQGLFVIESKYWKGVTFVFDGEEVNLFQQTMYGEFGKAKETVIKAGSKDGRFRVFNAQFHEEEGKMVLQTHQNPIVQARNYARALAPIVQSNSIKNLAVFGSGKGLELRYNRQPLNGIKRIDSYTSLMQHNHLENYFKNQRASAAFAKEAVRIRGFVDRKLSCNLRIDKSNYREYR